MFRLPDSIHSHRYTVPITAKWTGSKYLYGLLVYTNAKMVKRYWRKPPNVERSLCLLGCIIVYYLSPWCLRGYATTYNCQSRVVVVVVSFEPPWILVLTMLDETQQWPAQRCFPCWGKGGARKWHAGSQTKAAVERNTAVQQAHVTLNNSGKGTLWKGASQGRKRTTETGTTDRGMLLN